MIAKCWLLSNTLHKLNSVAGWSTVINDDDESIPIKHEARNTATQSYTYIFRYH